MVVTKNTDIISAFSILLIIIYKIRIRDCNRSYSSTAQTAFAKSSTSCSTLKVK